MKLDQKKINKILTVVLVICLAVGLTAMYLTRTQEREPSAGETAMVDTYRVELPAELVADGASVKTAILASLCQPQGQQTVNGTQYEAYTSDTLLDCLPAGVTLKQILLSAEGTLYISYTAQGNLEVMLAYDDTGCVEKTLYDVNKDIMYHETDGTLRVYEHFSSSLGS